MLLDREMLAERIVCLAVAVAFSKRYETANNYAEVNAVIAKAASTRRVERTLMECLSKGKERARSKRDR